METGKHLVVIVLRVRLSRIIDIILLNYLGTIQPLHYLSFSKGSKED